MKKPTPVEGIVGLHEPTFKIATKICFWRQDNKRERGVLKKGGGDKFSPGGGKGGGVPVAAVALGCKQKESERRTRCLPALQKKRAERGPSKVGRNGMNPTKGDIGEWNDLGNLFKRKVLASPPHRINQREV